MRSIGRLSTLWDGIVASDPGYARLRFAGRTTVTVALTLGLLIALAHLVGQSFFSFLIGVVVSMISSVAVNDPDRSAQRVTAALIPVPALLSITLGSLLSFSPYLAEAVFVVVMFFAVFVRRFGPRWFAFGMVGFVSYFFAMFLRATPQQLPWMYLAVGIGAAVNGLMRFVVMRDPVQMDIGRTVPAVRARIRQSLTGLAALLEPGRRRERKYRTLRRQIVRLNEIAIAFSDQPHGKEWDQAVFGAELALQQLTELAHRGPAGDDDLHADISALKRALRKDHPVALECLFWHTEGEGRYGRLLRNLAESVLHGYRAERGESREEEADRDEPGGRDQEAEPNGDRSGPVGLHPVTRTAIQASAASAIAIVGGELLSTRRWYWAAITAFVVFTGTSSRGDVFVKGWQRIAGTLGGVAAGIALATVIHGNQPVSLILIFASIFLAFYTIRISYAIMIFWITILLALLYGLLGFFSIHILALRLSETAVGAGAGILVALFLLPTRTRTLLVEQSRTFLTILGELIGLCGKVLHGGESAPRAMDRARELDRSYQTLRQTAGPLMIRLPGVTEPRTSQHWLRVLLNLRYEAHHLVRLVHERWSPSGLRTDRWTHAADRLQERIAGLAEAAGDSAVSRHAMMHAQQTDAETMADVYGDPLSETARCFQRIDWITTLLALDMGLVDGPVLPETGETLPRR
ncbi:FUSC family protein [Salinispira pacifica]